jgi:hypothetical protein
VTSRVVRFGGLFFERLDELLPETRGTDGTPSSSDFLFYDLPPVRDLLAADFEGQTVAVPPGDEVRVYIGSGVLVGRFALFATIAADGAIEVLDVELDLDRNDP